MASKCLSMAPQQLVLYESSPAITIHQRKTHLWTRRIPILFGLAALFYVALVIFSNRWNAVSANIGQIEGYFSSSTNCHLRENFGPFFYLTLLEEKRLHLGPILTIFRLTTCNVSPFHSQTQSALPEASNLGQNEPHIMDIWRYGYMDSQI